MPDKTSLVGRISRLVSGSLLANLIVLVSTPLLARLYPPEAFGQLAVFISVTGLIATGLCLRLEQAVYLPRSRRRSAVLVLTGMLVASALAGLLQLLYLISGNWSGHSLAGRLNAWVPAAALALALYNLLANWAVREHLISLVNRTRVFRAVVQVATQLGLGLGGYSAGLVAGEVAGRGTGIAAPARRLLSGFVGAWPAPALLWRVLRRYRRFVLIGTPAALLNVAVMQSPAVLLAWFYSPAAAGLYFMTQRLVAAPMAIIGQAVAQAYTAELARRLQQSAPQAGRLYFRTVGWLGLLGGVPLCALAVVAPWGLPWLLGAEWQQAGLFVSVLLGFFIGQFVMSPLANSLNILDRQHWLFAWDALRLLLVLLAFWLPSRLGWPVWQALLCFSLVMAVSYVLLFFVIAHAIRQSAAAVRRAASG